MKLLGLQIENFRQFKDFRLDFTDPATGKPLEKVCFIGPNGTGKSTLIKNIAGHSLGFLEFEPNIHTNPLEGRCDWSYDGVNLVTVQAKRGERAESLRPINSQLVIICPAEGDWEFRISTNEVERWGEIPPSSLNRALEFPAIFHPKQIVGMDTASSFWTKLIAHLKRREQSYLAFQKLAESRAKTIAQLDAEYDSAHPHVLDKLAEVWDRILGVAGLEVDREFVEIPFQLTDNLKAYLRTKNNKTRVHYWMLSTGIRQYLFRLGHIWSLYFNRPSGDSLLLVDEPEGSLYPDFLYDIVENYREVAPGCQLFMATHSPIVASQFKPEERFILTFGDDGYVTARRGISPEGDDPNDLLDKDFGVRNLMPAAGQEKWARFLELRRRIPLTPPDQRLPLVEESARIGHDYNFPLNGT